MKRVAPACLAVLLSASPALAQEAETPPETPPPDAGEAENGLSLMEEGAKLFMRGIMNEMEPALRELEGMARDFEPALRDFAEQMGPALRDLFAEVEDWSAYHPPEMLPNGDIILRRKTPEEMAPDPEAGPDGSIEL
ncbi:hypothetical protein [Rhodosalinus sp. 5P4]|uniref:hypothetical protein n=1 Tax=Rhodosalinus sp. 5P4 TaxID=3239196 RepID=UPI0035259C82